METKEIYDELCNLLCNQDKALKELVWTIARNQKLSRPRNVLLVGELGSGKSTMVELTASQMGIPLVNVTGFCSPEGLDSTVLFNAFSRLYVLNNNENLNGIVLIHDMKDCFLYGGFSALHSLITSGTFTFENRMMNISNTMFIGEIDNNGFEDCFCPKPVYTEDNLEEAILSLEYSGDEVQKLIRDLIDFGSEIDDVEEKYSDQYREAIVRTFLSVECSKSFSKKIFMENMCFTDIKKVLNSPISELQTYNDDLEDEYITSPHFISLVANHIRESKVGLHDLDDAVQEVARNDSKRKIKVYKEHSLMGL